MVKFYGLLQVKFGDVDQIVDPPEIAACAEDLTAARLGPWQGYAVDRCRFRRRVHEVEEAVGHHFTPLHRDYVWAKRNVDR